jgi:hypothetical protein
LTARGIPSLPIPAQTDVEAKLWAYLPEIVDVNSGDQIHCVSIIDHIDWSVTALRAGSIDGKNQGVGVRGDIICSEIEPRANTMLAQYVGKIPLEGVVEVFVCSLRCHSLINEFAGIIGQVLLRNAVDGI